MSEPLTEAELVWLEKFPNVKGTADLTMHNAAAEIRRLRAELAARDGDWEVQSKTLSDTLEQLELAEKELAAHVVMQCDNCGRMMAWNDGVIQQLAAANAKADRLAEALREAIQQIRWLNQRPAWVTSGPFLDKLEAALTDHDAEKGKQ